MKTKILLLLLIVLCFFYNSSAQLIASYSFNGNANDVTGNGHNGTVNGATLTTDRNSNANSAYAFNGSNQYIYVPYDTAFNFAPAGQFTISLWIKPNAFGQAGALFVKSPTGSSCYNALWDYGIYLIGNNNIMIGYANNNLCMGSTQLQVGKWYCVVGTYNNGDWKVYVNGTLDASVLSSGKYIRQSTGGISIGRKGDYPCDYFNGSLDDVRLYGQALSDSAVAQMCNGTTTATCALCNLTDLPSNLQSGLIGYYPFCGNANDVSVNHNNATVYGAVSANDRFGNASSAYYFNGSSDYMAAAHINQYITNYNISIAAWVKHAGLNTDTNCSNGCAQYIVTVGNDRQNGSVGYGLQQQGKNPWFAMVDPFANNGWMFSNAGYPNPNQTWHFVVMTYDHASLKLYVDCVLDTSISYVSPNTFCTDSIRIGKHQINLNYPYYTHGYIDDVMIYNRALSSSEVSQLCNLCTNTPVSNFVPTDTVFCGETGGCIDFVDHSTGNPTSWKWLFPGATPDTSSLQNPTNICYGFAGTYPVTLIVSNSLGTDTLTVSPMVIYSAGPTVPTITIKSGDTLVSSPAYSYLWYYNGQPIGGAINSFYVAHQPGTYAVWVTDSLGCGKISNGILIVSVDELANQLTVKIYPNPVTSASVIEFITPLKNAEVVIYDMVGKEMVRKKLSGDRMEIEKGSLESGVYFVRVSTQEKQWVEKMVVE